MGSITKDEGPSVSRAKELLATEHQYALVGHAMPVFVEKAEGTKIWDVDGKEYLDFTCMLGALNQGHRHPDIAAAVVKQLLQVPLVNIAAHSVNWPGFAKTMCQRFGYDKITSMMTGTDADETACKIARKWGIAEKKIPKDDLLILGFSNCYHGHSAAMWSFQGHQFLKDAYGLDDKHLTNRDPDTGEVLAYGDVKGIKDLIERKGDKVAAVIVECIRNHLSSIEEEIQFCEQVYDLCAKHNILFIADEVRMGCGKTGRFFSYQHLSGSRQPDLVACGKSITGGYYPASFVLGKSKCMDLILKHEAVTTYSFSPLAIAAAEAGIKVIDDERLVDRALDIQGWFNEELATWKHKFITRYSVIGGEVLILTEGLNQEQIMSIPRTSMELGLLISPVGDRVRLNVPLVVPKVELKKGLSILKTVFDRVEASG